MPILLFILLTNGLYSQSSHKKDKKDTKFIVAFSGGLNFSKASDNMMEAMLFCGHHAWIWLKVVATGLAAAQFIMPF